MLGRERVREGENQREGIGERGQEGASWEGVGEGGNLRGGKVWGGFRENAREGACQRERAKEGWPERDGAGEGVCQGGSREGIREGWGRRESAREG